MSNCSVPAWSSTPVPVPVYGTGATLPQLQSNAMASCSTGSAACAQSVAKLAFNAKATSMGRTLPPAQNPVNPLISLVSGTYSYAPVDGATYTSLVNQSNNQLAATNCQDSLCCGTTNAKCGTCHGASVASLVERL